MLFPKEIKDDLLSVMSDLTKAIAISKAMSRCKGPWFSTCTICGKRYRSSEKSSHLESECLANRLGIVLKRHPSSEPSQRLPRKKRVSPKSQVRSALKELLSVRVTTGNDGVISATIPKSAAKTQKPTTLRRPFKKDDFLNNLGRAMEDSGL